MFKSFFRKDPALEAGEALYAAAVDQARAAPLYADFGAPDTVEGRFEMVALHVYMILRALKEDAPDAEKRGAKKVGQRLLDSMFRNMDDSLRELGVGDLAVGKKIRKMAESFYGRIAAYEDALAPGADEQDLAKALARNVFEESDSSVAEKLAAYARKTSAAIEEQAGPRLIGGIVHFPEAT